VTKVNALQELSVSLVPCMILVLLNVLLILIVKEKDKFAMQIFNVHVQILNAKKLQDLLVQNKPQMEFVNVILLNVTIFMLLDQEKETN